jgi:hypothetical protein
MKFFPTLWERLYWIAGEILQLADICRQQTKGNKNTVMIGAATASDK